MGDDWFDSGDAWSKEPPPAPTNPNATLAPPMPKPRPGGGIPLPPAPGGIPLPGMGVTAPGMGVSAPGMGVSAPAAPGMGVAAPGMGVAPPAAPAAAPFAQGGPAPGPFGQQPGLDRGASPGMAEGGFGNMGMAMSMGMASMGMAPPNGAQAAVAGMVADQVGNQVNSALLRWFPAVMTGLRDYFNVNHRYVALKLAFLVAPVKPVKSSEYQMGEDGARPLHVPDLYIPLMSYITYVIMLGIKLGLEGDSFHPEYLNQTATFAAVIIVLEVLCAKVAFYLAACNHVKMLDLMAHAGSKFVHLVLQVAFAAFLPPALQWGSFAVLAASCGWGVKQVLSAMDLPAHQPLVKYVILGLGGSQVLLLYVLMP